MFLNSCKLEVLPHIATRWKHVQALSSCNFFILCTVDVTAAAVVSAAIVAEKCLRATFVMHFILNFCFLTKIAN